MSYLYETHLHTSVASACGRSVGSEYIQRYLDAGYSGIIVTDHFFNGNSSIPSNLPWKERVNRLCAGYEETKEVGDQLGLSVFFGFEYSYGVDEYLIYGVDKEWLIDHPEIMRLDHQSLFETVDSLDGLMIQAHPFRERSYLWEINLHPYSVHGVEVTNGENDPECNRKAYAYAKAHNLSMTSGADIHSALKVGSTTQPMRFDYPLDSIADFIAAVKANKGYATTIVDQIAPRNTTTVPVHYYDESNRVRKIQIKEAWA